MAKQYLKYDEVTIDPADKAEINRRYEQGYLFGRIERGYMYQTRSLRLRLAEFTPSSENRRILRKNEQLAVEPKQIPYEDYSWQIHKMGKEFYQTKFGDGTMSASKIKSMFTDPKSENMNQVLVYSWEGETIGYCLCYLGQEFLHYNYPFYDLNRETGNLGMGMMLKAILWAQEQGLRYIYLGSVADNSSRYKLQFSGLEWWENGERRTEDRGRAGSKVRNEESGTRRILTGNWNKDIDVLKEVIEDLQN